IAPCRSALERRVRNILRGAHASSPLTSRLRAAVILGTLAAVGAGLLLISAAAAPPDAPAKDPLADDARLAQTVRVTVEGLPVSGLDLKPEQLDRSENQDIQWHMSDRKRRFALMLYRQLSQAQREALFQSESLRIPFRALTPAQQPPVRAVFADIIGEEKAFS